VKCNLLNMPFSHKPVPVATRSRAKVCGRSPSKTVGLNPARGMDVCSECSLLSSRGHCDEPITRPGESYRLWCVVVYHLETSSMKTLWTALGLRAKGKNIYIFTYDNTVLTNHSLIACISWKCYTNKHGHQERHNEFFPRNGESLHIYDNGSRSILANV
jgi:hypothetical protein